MSHLNENVQGAVPTSTGAITGSLADASALGYALNHSQNEVGTGTGNYSDGDYYLFFTGADSYSGVASVSSDTITLPKGTFYIKCVPTFGDASSSAGNSEIRLQFVDRDDNAVGNLGAVNLENTGATYPSVGLCTALVDGPNIVKLKVVGTPIGSFPKNGTESLQSPFFLEIMRIK